MRRRRSFTNQFARLLILLGLIAGGGWLIYQALLFTQVRESLPNGTYIADLNVSGLTLAQARERVESTYMAPVMVYYLDEPVEIDPTHAGYTIDLEGMMRVVVNHRESMTVWERFAAFLMERPLSAVEVPLSASHDDASLREVLNVVAGLLDQPVQQPVFEPEEAQMVNSGRPGHFLDVEASMPAVAEAFYHPNNRSARLVVEEEPPAEFGIDALRAALQAEINEFNGVGIVFIMDLETGEEVTINSDLALSGISIVKIAIMLETYRRAYVGTPPPYEFDLMQMTAAESSDWAANLLLDRVAGMNNAYLGVDILTETMQELGLENTYIVTPYQEPARPERASLVTPANSDPDALNGLDPAMQTTAEEIGTLLSMIYYCAQGKGPLLLLYPDELSPNECQELINVMGENVEGNLIRWGVPDGVLVSHKHGWAGGLHGDAGIVFGPEKDYVIVTYLYQDTTWLVADYSFPILREMSRITYNYFHMDDPYEGHPLRDIPALEEETVEGEAVESEETESDTTGAGGLGADTEGEATPEVTPEPTEEVTPEPTEMPTQTPIPSSDA